MTPLEVLLQYRWTVAWWVAVAYAVAVCVLTTARPFG